MSAGLIVIAVMVALAIVAALWLVSYRSARSGYLLALDHVDATVLACGARHQSAPQATDITARLRMEARS